MSIPSHHTEWLSLLDVSGPFLSLPVLKDAWPQGLPAVEAGLRSDLRMAAEEWEGESDDARIHRAWIDFILRRVLGWPEGQIVEGEDIAGNLRAREAEQGETLRPDLVLINPAAWESNAGMPRVLISLYPATQQLERPIVGKVWKASPATRMMELLHGAGVVLGLVTNGAQWMLVHAPVGESAAYISWYTNLLLDEPPTFQAFATLLGAPLLFGETDERTLEALLKKSAERQQEVTEQLGLQVRASVEILVQAIDRLDAGRGGALLEGISESHLYESAVTVMMRLVFLLSAEERGLLLHNASELYDSHYAASTLAAQLRETADRHGEELLERRHDAWARLLALFRGVYGGLRHEDLHLPAYGGALFDPDRFPFLEGRPPDTHWRDTKADPLAVDNRTVLHVLESLQFLNERDARGTSEPRRLSFRALDIEQIGHVYESLLDHTVRRAPAEVPVLGLIGKKGYEPEVDLGTLEQLAASWTPEKGAMPSGLEAFLTEQSGRSVGALRKAAASESDAHRAAQLRAACGQNEELYIRIMPWAGLIRDDSYGRPVLIPPGAAYVTQGSERRETGTHYTPRSLTTELVRHTLDPLVYDGAADGQPREKWKLRTPENILALRVCDIAVGSAAFLVQVCRYLSERLAESWDIHGAPDDLPSEADDRLLHARRLVAGQCLYGVDRNPLAVQMARLSLWLVTMAREKPFTFLDHAVKCGDSLLGFATMEQLEVMHPVPSAGQQIGAWHESVSAAVERAVDFRRQIESFPVAGLADAQRKRDMLADAEQAITQSRRLCDAVIAAAVHTADGGAKKRGGNPHPKFEELRRGVLSAFDDAEAFDDVDRKLRTMLNEYKSPVDDRLPFHWPLEFPEVFVNGGFDAIVSNPPFLGGQKLTGSLGTDYRNYLVDFLADGTKGSADLCAYFFLRAGNLIRKGGNSGMLATNTIAQGDTREVGLDQMTTNRGLDIYRGVKSRKWPGEANLEIAQLWLYRGEWKGEYDLDGGIVKGISPYLSIPGKIEGPPKRLKENMGKSFIGSYVLGKGFIVEIDEAKRLLDKDPRNKDVLFPYLNGHDLNNRPDQSPSRWVINFHDWQLERARDYPEVFRIVEEKVKPERMKNKRKQRRDRWWQYAECAPGLYKAIEGMERVLVTGMISKYRNYAFYGTDIVYMHMTVVLRFSEWKNLAVISSVIHEIWARKLGSSLETRMIYAPTDVFETFPFHFRVDSSHAEHYYKLAAKIMKEDGIGLTVLNNRINQPSEMGNEVIRLREDIVNNNLNILAVYGWSDVPQHWDFHEKNGEIRFSLPDEIEDEIFWRTREMNHSCKNEP